MLFIRDRGHTCDICNIVESAHFKRHKEVFEKVRELHRLCGSQWAPKFDCEIDEGPRAETKALNDAGQRDDAPEEKVRQTKRNKKAAKKQQKAAAREKNVVTDKDVDFIAGVLHTKNAPVVSSDLDSIKDIEEADERLRDMALRYLTGSRWTRIGEPHDTINFESEMTRILEAFQINALIQDNDMARGLLRKEFSKILSTVGDLKNMIVEDMIAVRRDDMETSMRRSAFIRFVGKSSFDSIETRYEQKDRTTGQKIPIEERQPELPGDLMAAQQDEETSADNEDGAPREYVQSPLAERPVCADLRHEELPYRTISRNDRSSETPSTQSDEAHKTLQEEGTPRVSRRLRIVETESPTGVQFHDPWTLPKRHGEDFKHIFGLSESSEAAENKLPSSPKAVTISSLPSHPGAIRSTGYDSANEQETPLKLRVNKAITAQTQHPHEPVQVPSMTEANSPIQTHRRKKKRKPKAGLATTDGKDYDVKQEDVVKQEDAVKQKDTAKQEDTLEQETVIEPETLSKASPKKTKHHDDWQKYQKYLKVDCATTPMFAETHPACGNLDNACPFEDTNTPDCPYHRPHFECTDPMNQVNNNFIVFPEFSAKLAGPFNYLRGQKLLRLYNTYPDTKNKLMLVDQDLARWFIIAYDRNYDIARMSVMLIQETIDADMPLRVRQEIKHHILGGGKGPILQQMDGYRKLAEQNTRIPDVEKVTPSLLKQLILKWEPRTVPEEDFICFCRETMPDNPKDGELVYCAHKGCLYKIHHRSCVEAFNPDLVTRFYCTACGNMMQKTAKRYLEDLESAAKGKPPRKPQNLCWEITLKDCTVSYNLIWV